MNYSMGYSQGLHHAEAQGYSAQYPADTNDRIERCPTDSQAALRDCIEEAIASSHDAQRSERDLNAQRDMAKWAWWLMVISLATLIVSGIGLAALLRTIQQGQEGLVRAAEANEIARISHEQQTRPILTLHSPNLEPVPGGWDYRFTFQNIGSSPAYVCEVSWCRKMTAVDHNLEPIMEPLEFSRSAEPNERIVPTGGPCILPLGRLQAQNVMGFRCELVANVKYSSVYTDSKGNRGRVYETESYAEIKPLQADGTVLIQGPITFEEIVNLTPWIVRPAVKLT